jgi:aminoglycoside phosphotransferase (APT) family kinase protein
LAIEVAIEQFAGVDEWAPSVLHGDFHAGNVLTSDGAVTAIVDWEESACGDRRWDLVTMVDSLGPESREARSFLQAYQRSSALEIGDLRPWSNLRWLRDLVVAEWIKSQSAIPENPPVTNVVSWSRYSVGLETRVAEWLRSVSRPQK